MAFTLSSSHSGSPSLRLRPTWKKPAGKAPSWRYKISYRPSVISLTIRSFPSINVHSELLRLAFHLSVSRSAILIPATPSGASGADAAESSATSQSLTTALLVELLLADGLLDAAFATMFLVIPSTTLGLASALLCFTLSTVRTGRTSRPVTRNFKSERCRPAANCSCKFTTALTASVLRVSPTRLENMRAKSSPALTGRFDSTPLASLFSNSSALTSPRCSLAPSPALTTLSISLPLPAIACSSLLRAPGVNIPNIPVASIATAASDLPPR